MIDMHSFGDWLRQIKGDTGKKKKKVQQPDSVVWMLGAWVEGEDWFKKKKKRKATKQKKKQIVTQKEKASTCIWTKGEFNRDLESLLNFDLERRGYF